MKRKKFYFQFRFILVFLCFLIETLLILGLLTLLILFPYTATYSYIAIFLVVLLNIVVGIFIFNSKANIDFKISWLTVVLALPPIGAFLYLMYAQKLTTKKKMRLRYNPINEVMEKGREDSEKELKKIEEVDPNASILAKYLYNNAKASLYQNTKVTYYPLGDVGIPEIVKELKKAKKFIFIEYFIIEFGEVFSQVYEVLKEKAKLGLDVRLIYDDFGSNQKVNATFYKQAIEDGIKCFPFNRIRPTVDIRQNCRDHRKIVVIDGVVGFTGGVNLADEYANIVTKFGHWKDNVIKIKGEAVSGLTSIFLTNWTLNERVKEDMNKYFYKENSKYLDENIKSNSFVQPYGQVPFVGEDVARNAYLKLFYLATKYIYICTPYLILDEELVTALMNCAKSGIDVRIVIPGIPDKKIVYTLTQSYIPQLLSAGIKVYTYKPGFNHTKMVVVDDKYAITGTINLDYRSMFLHFENAILFINDKAILDMKQDILGMINVGVEQEVEYWISRPLIVRFYWSVLKIIGPLM